MAATLIDRIWNRHRRSTPVFAPDEIAATWQLCSLLLDYPGERLLAMLPDLRRVAVALPPALGGGVVAFVDAAASTSLGELQREYVETFDVTRKCALHLTYATCGDTRRRGVALVQFKQAYRASGVEMGDADAELPDYLPMVLEFGATVDRAAAWKLLCDHRVSIELLQRALTTRSSRWLPVLEALRATLPALDGTDEEALAALIAAGPPHEEVGMDEGYGAAAFQDPRLLSGPTIPVGAPR